MKTAKMMQDFNCFCNLGMNHKLYVHNLSCLSLYNTQEDNKPCPLRCLHVVAANAHLVQQ